MAEKPQRKIQKAALQITHWVGSPQSILIHTLLFVGTITLLVSNVFPFDAVILIFNTAVSLEAIYLALFIQMTVNYANESLEEVEQDIDEIQEDVEKIEKDVDEIQEDVEEIEKDVDEIHEDVEDMSEEDKKEDKMEKEHHAALEDIQKNLKQLMKDIERLQGKN